MSWWLLLAVLVYAFCLAPVGGAANELSPFARFFYQTSTSTVCKPSHSPNPNTKQQTSWT